MQAGELSLQVVPHQDFDCEGNSELGLGVNIYGTSGRCNKEEILGLIHHKFLMCRNKIDIGTSRYF